MYALRERRIHVTQEDFELAVGKVMNRNQETAISRPSCLSDGKNKRERQRERRMYMGRYVCRFLTFHTPPFSTLVFCLGALSSIYKYIYLYTKSI